MNEDVNGSGRLVQGEDKAQNIWKEYFEDLFNIDTQEEVVVNTCGLEVVTSPNSIRGEG